MEGLVAGRIVYLVLAGWHADEIMRRRKVARAAQEAATAMPQLCDGNDVKAGDIVPAMVLKVWNEGDGASNLKAMLDGHDTFWATSVSYNADKAPGTWHWMFDGQNKRYAPGAAFLAGEHAKPGETIETLTAASTPTA